MQIKDVIDILEISKFVPICPQMYGNPKDGYAIYASEHGICYWEGESIKSLANDDRCKKNVDNIKFKITTKEKELEGKGRRLNRFLVVYELLRAIDLYNDGTGKVDLKKTKEYANKLDQAIIDELDFQKIDGMKGLIDFITMDDWLRELLFNIDEVHSTREREYCRGTEKIRYTFGNRKYHEELDVVKITIYDDSAELYLEAAGEFHPPYKLDGHTYRTAEQKIVYVLGCWHNKIFN